MTDVSSVVARFSDGDLETVLQEIIGPDLTLLSRVSTDYMSSHPMEDVSIAVGGESLDVVCKYSAPGIDRVAGHIRGVAYEAEIYRRAFPNPDLTTPVFYGTFSLGDSVDCIVLEKVPGYRIHHSTFPRGLVDASADLGGFHSHGIGSLPPAHNVFNRSHFSRLMSEMELLPGVSARLTGMGSTVVDVLANAPRSLIHGELYPDNVLINEEGPVVVDWESAGVGPGILDFATLTQGRWDPDLVGECEEVYWGARGDFVPAWGRRSLAAARIMAAGLLLVHLRGEPTDGTKEEIALETIAAQVSRLKP